MLFDAKIDYQNPDRSFRFAINRSVGHYNMSRYHLHDHLELYYLLTGERYYFIKDRTFLVKKGDLVLIGPRILHKTMDTGVPDHQRILIYFQEGFTASLSPDLAVLLNEIFTAQPLLRLSISGQNHLEYLFQQMCNEVRELHAGTETMLQAYLLQLLVNAVRFRAQHQTQAFEHPSPMHKKISEIVQYINENYAEPLNLTAVAGRFFISSYHLSRSFKEATGFTFVEYLNSVRVKEAQRLLRESDFKVIRIAEQVGFGSIAHFGRVFKTLTGHSPLDYRKLQ
ncbi:MAG TPA: AraC family transcriptional regulator [Bacillota bacterium]|nr:AraC family transcriptional regulator [Bacillota bacterium]